MSGAIGSSAVGSSPDDEWRKVNWTGRSRLYTVDMITLYGIKNCDTMKKARTWLDSHGVPYEFHDYKIAGIDADRLKRWVGQVGWEVLLNRAGTTFRKLPDEQKTGLNAGKAISLMVAQPSMIKRPVLENGQRLLVGFDPANYKKALTSG
jgi:arsenate reductase (glutaredoxin)